MARKRPIALGALAWAVALCSAPCRSQDDFRRGDANADGRIDLADCGRIINFLLPGGGAFPCLDAADADDDGAILAADASLLLGYLYLGGPAPPLPSTTCGPDPTPDALVVCSYPAGLCGPQPERAESPDFELVILGEPLEVKGAPGAPVSLGSFAAGLCNGDGSAEEARFQVQAWSIGIASSGCTLRGPTTRGTAGAEGLADPAGRRAGGFEKTELASGLQGHDSGAVSAVMLSFTLPVALEERAVGPACDPHVLLRFDLEAQVPAAGETRTCRLLFAGGLKGTGLPVVNLATTASGAFKPTSRSREFEIQGPALAAAIEAPGQVVLLGASAAIHASGKGSTDPRGDRALLYAWSAVPPPAAPPAAVARRRAASTKVTFASPGAYAVDLTVFGGRQFELSETARTVVSVFRPEDLPPAAPAFAPVDGELLTALTGRPFDLVLTLTAGSPRPALRVLGEAPPGLSLDQEGKVLWTPGREQVGLHRLSVMASNALGETRLDLDIRVVDQFEALAFLGAGAPARDGGDGGGGALREAPESIGDRSLVPPELRLYLQFAPGSEATSAQEVVPDDPGAGPDRFSALRFSPEAPAGNAPSGAVYRSGASASKLFTEVVEGAGNFTVEAWLSRVPLGQPGAAGAGPATLLAMAEQDPGDSSWVLGVTDGGFVMRVSALPRDVDLRVSADFSGPDPRHLVFVREGPRHRFFVDGIEASAAEEESDLAWSTDHELFLANDGSLTRPFTGDVHLAAFYAEALSPAHIAHLHEIGLREPPAPNPPLVFICPDPFIIARGEVDVLADATPFAGGGGGGGGAAGECFESDLREVIWSLTPSEAIEEGAVRLEPLPAPAACLRRARIHYRPDLSELDLTVELEVAQVPVRGRTETARTAYLLHLPVRQLFRRGDVNGSGAVDISDPIAALGFLFDDGDPPGCRDAADANDDGVLDVSDAIVVLNHLFVGELEIAPPGPARCGEDPGGPDAPRDDLDCRRYPEAGGPGACPPN
ncbi:MAG: hypothetical protein HY721_27190 [Planctomycetes bacterium]|nr:hypothetical protein [Planctomycetota bacterium]